MRRPYHGGENAREWRRKIAALADRQQEDIRTYKFRIEADAEDFDLPAAARAYDITEGVRRGSLIGLVCAVHLSGFRIFPTGRETRQFRDRDRYPESAFAAALRSHVGIDNPGVTIPSIEKVFAQPPRRKNGADPPWSPDDLAHRLFQAWCRRSPKENEKTEPAYRFADGIAREVAAGFGGWQELALNVPDALACVDRHLERFGNAFPKLGQLPPEADFRPPHCTLAYDSEARFVEMSGGKEIWLHQTVAICARRLQNVPHLSPLDFGKRLVDLIVTEQHNGLQWLFGNGLRYLQKHEPRSIAEDLGVPDSELRKVEQLKAFGDAIVPNPLFAKKGYPEFRGSVGGKIRSWVSNYWKRLSELADLHSDPPSIDISAELGHDENAALFSGQHIDPNGLASLSRQLPERIRKAGSALDVLRGAGIPYQTEINAVEKIADYIAELAGQINMLDNRIDQEIERQPHRAAALQSLKPTPSTALNEPPKLNKISGGAADANEEIRGLQDEMNDVLRERGDHYRRLVAWVEGRGLVLDPSPAMTDRERRALQDRGQNPSDAAEQAVRRFLHRIAVMSRRLSADSAVPIREALTPLFLRKKEANLYFHNRLGALYRHPFSSTRHQPYAIDIERARETDWLAWLSRRADDIRTRLNTDDGPELLRDLLAIEGFVMTERLGGLPKRVPGRLATPRSKHFGIPPLLSAQLNADEVSRDVASRAFNLFSGAINGLSFRMFRDGFVVRTKFQRLGRDALFYVPKNKAWRPPDDYLSAKGAIAKGMALAAVAHDEAGAILPLETAAGLSRARFPEPGSRALLRQAPHDWFVELDLRLGEVPDRTGLPVKKNGSGLQSLRRTREPAFRLMGPPHFKTLLDRTLTDSELKLGDYTLILDRHFRQSVTFGQGQIRLAAQPSGLRADLAVSVVDDRPFPEEDSALLFDNIVAFDLGEKRVGFSVFSIADLLESGRFDPVTGGSVAVPAFRRLMAAVQRHRNRRQPNQKIDLTYSKSLMQFRENVVGDVCNRIDTLCERYRGFPVLEGSIGNLEAGAKQLSLIYGSVLRRYVFFGVEAHKAIRRHYWFTAEKWRHPYLFVRGWNESENRHSGRPERLNLFPGVKVNPAGTSQICSRCNRNALSKVRELSDRVTIGRDGTVALDDGEIRVLVAACHSPDAVRKFRRRKERPPLNVPMQTGIHKRSDVERAVKRNMRQRPRSEMSPDTRQSRFVCVYTDCGFEGHADENAAINIGRRFLERIDIERSKAELRS